MSLQGQRKFWKLHPPMPCFFFQMLNFILNKDKHTHKKLPIACLYGQSKGCLLWVHSLVSILFLDNEMLQDVKIHSHGGYLVQSISWLVMTWRHQEPGHHQPRYWPSLPVFEIHSWENISYNQYYGWRWPGDSRSQGISSHDIDLVCW